MSKRAPSTAQLLVIAGFALSCFGILLFLWITFGGPTPFKAKPYEIKVPFNEATQLAQQSDVRISGVSVGKVQTIEESPDGQQAQATIDIEDKYAPIPQGTRAILRTKTLLGETYVELTPGDADGPELHDGATLAKANVAESVQLDEIFRTFDTRTRAAFQEWMQEGAIAISGRGQSFSNALGELDPFFTEFDRLFRAARHAAARGPAAVQQRRRHPARPARPRRRARQPDPQLQRGLHDDRGARPRHRSAVPRLPDLPGRVAADLRPAQRVRAQRRPALPPARPGGRTALADADRPGQLRAAG